MGAASQDTQTDHLRVGYGFDIHRLVHDRPLVLGGVSFDFPMGLDGHSDADVLLHAIIDAMLGAAALGDIGQHYPNTQEEWRGVSSLVLLRKAAGLLGERGMQVVNIDATLVAERPNISARTPEMCHLIAEALNLGQEAVNVKATTAEGLGPEGRGEGMSARAVALIQEIS